MDNNTTSFKNMSIEDKVYLFYCWLGSGKHFLTTCTSPNKFFENYDSIISILEQLNQIEKDNLYEFYEPLPSFELSQYTSDEFYNKLVNDFITRFWYKILNEAQKYKTYSRKVEKINSFQHNIQQYKCRFTDENLSLIEELLSKELNLDFLPVKPKKKTNFDKFKEQSLLNTLKNQSNAYSRHRCYNELIDFYFKYRNDYPETIYKCIKLCVEDINSLPDIESSYVKQQIESVSNLYSYDLETRKQRIKEIKERGFHATIPAFDKITMLYFYTKDYNSAIRYCKLAIEYGQDCDLKYTKRIERFKKKRATEEKKLYDTELLHND